MKRKTSVSHDETMIRRIRQDPQFAAEYLRAALEDTDEPRVLLLALRHVAQAHGIGKIAKSAGPAREPVSSTVRQWESTPLHVARRCKGNWLKAEA